MASSTEIRDNETVPAVRGALLLALVLCLAAAGCESVSGTGPENAADPVPRGALPGDGWLIPRSEVLDGGPGKDGIPSVDRPVFGSPADVRFVDDDRLVLGVRIGDMARAYPHQVLDWHEIVNDRLGETAFAVTYCPLTGTGTTWDREVDGRVTEFGVSGLLFRNNLIAYDRRTDSHWSQMQLRSVNGAHAGTSIRTIHTVQMTWKHWREMYPDSEVMTGDTGFRRGYAGYAYGRFYASNHAQILFPLRHPDARLQNKERVHGIITETPADEEARARVYVVSRFGPGLHVIEDQIGTQRYVVVGSSDMDFATAFERPHTMDAGHAFEAVHGALPVVMEDGEGNRWDVFGRAVAGPRTGDRLTPARSYTGYWFGWADFFPGVEIYEE